MSIPKITTTSNSSRRTSTFSWNQGSPPARMIEHRDAWITSSWTSRVSKNLPMMMRPTMLPTTALDRQRTTLKSGHGRQTIRLVSSEERRASTKKCNVPWLTGGTDDYSGRFHLYSMRDNSLFRYPYSVRSDDGLMPWFNSLKSRGYSVFST